MIWLLIFLVFLICSFWFFGRSENDVGGFNKIKSVKKKKSSIPSIWQFITHGYTLLFKMSGDGEIVFFN